MTEAEAAAARIERLFGAAPDLSARAIHVAAVWEDERSRRRFLSIQPGSPESDTDRFVLDFARARADAILTTGSILRAEPDVTHAIATGSLRAFRRHRLGKAAPPKSVVLTSGRDLDLEHPLFSDASGAMLLVPADATLPAAIALPVLRAPALDAVRAVELLLERFATLALEVGPGVSASLYESGRPVVDELLLSIYLEPELPPRYRGGLFPAPDVVSRCLALASTSPVELQVSGRWRFERYQPR